MSDAFTDLVTDPRVGLTLGPHPILDTLLSWEPEGSYVHELFAPADEYQCQLYAVARTPALEPDAVHDPPPRLIDLLRMVSRTPTGSLELGRALVTRTMTMPEAMAWHDNQRYLASLTMPDVMGQDA